MPPLPRLEQNLPRQTQQLAYSKESVHRERDLVWEYPSTADSYTPPCVKFDISEKEFSGPEVAHTFFKLIDGMLPTLETGGLVGRITADHPSTTSSTGMVGTDRARRSNPKVDLAIFESSGRNSEGLVSECDLTEEEKEASTSRHKHHIARAEWDRIVVPITVESSTRPCAFKPVSAEIQYPEAETTGNGTASGRIVEHIGKIFEHQHRIFVHSIYIHGSRVFLIRWDRLAAVVSKPFSLTKEPHKLLRFLFRLAKMSPAQRGYDTSIRPASEIEAKEFMAFIPVDSVPKTYLQDALRSDGDKEAAIFRVDLQDLESSDMTVNLVFARPRVLGEGIVGRATRGYVAYDLGEKRLVFLKDYWQSKTKSYHPELDTYKRLQAKEVPYIATPVGGGYVFSNSIQSEESLQKTTAQEHLPMVHGQSYCARVHYRFAVKEIGRPLEDYKDAEEMVGAVYYAVTAHRAAWEDAGVLHRDISSGNILITEDGDGLLNDWDMSKYDDEVANLQSPAFRSGTWPFMSALLLCCPKKPHQVSDDVESFVHVINWLTLRFQVSSTPEAIDCSLKMYEECRRTKKGFDVGGIIKLDNIRGGGGPGFNLDNIQPPALKDVAQKLWAMCRRHYSSAEVMEALKDIDPELKPESLVLSTTSGGRRYKKVPAPRGRYPRHASRSPPRTAPVGGKPLMNNHAEIEGILYEILEGDTDCTLWQGVKFGDQFLKRPAKRTCLTAPGGSAKLQGSATFQKPDQGMRKSQNVSKPRSTRSAASLEDPEVQGKSKRAKRNNAGRPPRVVERDEEGSDAGVGEDVDPFIT
ncbi:hypothetical protein NLI96_g4573 [Meripilus lineatus]|uniref:Protein kinase domain-containing protein n=1 Tax=Meripilus lineatus TaxID=2056292 RepID=A0AAD5V6J8_9APHY|nr:hypothetical protein NLI96_g4573 [Physisporinus lineatus]